MCKHCNGYGRTYTEMFPGVWKIQPCTCRANSTFDERMKRNRRRIEKAYERFGIRSKSCCGD